MKVSKIFSSCLLSAPVMVSPISSYAGIPQFFTSTPQITVNVGEGTSSYKVDYAINDGNCQGNPEHLKCTANPTASRGVNISVINSLMSDDLQERNNFYITEFVIYDEKDSKRIDLPNCDI